MSSAARCMLPGLEQTDSVSSKGGTSDVLSKAQAEIILFDDSDVITISTCISAAQQSSSHGDCRSANSDNLCEHGNSNG